MESVAQGHPEHEIYNHTYPIIIPGSKFYLHISTQAHTHILHIVVIDTDYIKLYIYIHTTKHLFYIIITLYTATRFQFNTQIHINGMTIISLIVQILAFMVTLVFV